MTPLDIVALVLLAVVLWFTCGWHDIFIDWQHERRAQKWLRERAEQRRRERGW